MKRQDGYTLIELLVVTAIISVLAATALPQFYPFKTRAYDTDAKSNLRNVFQSCKGYWAVSNSLNPCVLSTVSNNEYGFIQSSTVEITIASNSNNTESDFVASASHLWSSNTFMIDYTGIVTSAVGSGAGQSAGSGTGTGAGSGMSKAEKAAAKKKAREEAKAKKKKEREEKAAAKKKAREEAKAKKKKEREEKAAAKKKAREEAKAKKKKEREEKAAAKKKAREEAKAKKKKEREERAKKK